MVVAPQSLALEVGDAALSVEQRTTFIRPTGSNLRILKHAVFSLASVLRVRSPYSKEQTMWVYRKCQSGLCLVGLPSGRMSNRL